MKKRKENLRNSKCIGQQIAFGNTLRNYQNLFKRYQGKTFNYSKRILGILPSISRRLVSYGQFELISVIGRLPLRMVKTSFGFGSAITANMTE